MAPKGDHRRGKGKDESVFQRLRKAWIQDEGPHIRRAEMRAKRLSRRLPKKGGGK